MSDSSGFEDLGDLAPPPSERPRWLIPAALGALVVIVVVVVVVVVGGGGSSGASLSSYTSKADAICGQLNPQISQASASFKGALQSGDTSSASSDVQTVLTLGHEELGKIESLDQPSQDADLITRLYKDDNQELNDLAAGLSQSNSALFQQGVAEGNQAEQLASQIGMTTCAAVSSSG